jgi:hypothetical protein
MAGYVTSVPKDAKNFICHLAKFTATDCSRSTTQMSSRSIPRKTHADFGKQSDKHLAIYWHLAIYTSGSRMEKRKNIQQVINTAD